MTILKLAIRNLRGAGIRTWLNAIALSFAFVAIIFGQGMMQGMNKQAEDASTAFEFGGGQYWQKNYDPYDPLTLEDAHAPVPPVLESLAAAGKAAPVLVVAGSIYPQGRIKPVVLKGIDPAQRILALPTGALGDTTDELPLLIGARMAKSTGLAVGDQVTVQWRDVEGAFDARDGRVVKIMETSVVTVDVGQVWMPLETLQGLAGMGGEATTVTVAKGMSNVPAAEGWNFRAPAYLLSDLRQAVKTKTVGQLIVFTILFLLAMLAIFDTQVLSVFRRRREIGMLVALGMTRARVIVLFTLEGALHSILAALLGMVYGAPLFISLGRKGISIPGGDTWGYAMGDKLYPAFTIGLILGTTLLVFIVTTFVSWLPTRRIAKLNPTDALAGRGA
ncbi:MAG: FtsX-like permease family protein [candidate division WOR-3 bacterium]|nr:FtsX-like permease family protein [candidate division WOR-3 bacterium]